MFMSGMAVATFFRILFFVFFRTPEQGDVWWAALAFLHGTRFDFSSLCALNLIFILLIYFKNIRQNRIFLQIWIFVNFIYIGLLVGDFIHYSIYNKRMAWDVLGLFHGMKLGVILFMVSQFLIVVPILGISYLLVRYLILKTIPTNDEEIKNKYYPFYFVFVVLISIIGYRGGLQRRVLAIQHSWLYANGNSFFAAMTTNTLHNLLREGKAAKLPFDPRSIHSSLLPTWDRSLFSNQPILTKAPKNIMFVFFESLASYPYEHGHMPKLKNWISNHKKDLYFTTQLYANGKLSKDSLLSIFFGLPSYFDIHVFESKYSKNTFAGIGQIAKQMGQTSFYMDAAPAGMQFFDVIVKAAGFDAYISVQDKYKKVKNIPRNGWGVHDEVLYKEAIDYASKLDTPFLGAVFTVSSHTPFFGAPNRPVYKNEEKDYFVAVDYGDESLVNFLNEASTKEWYKDTLFIMTGDHSPPLSSKWNRDVNEISRVPFLLYWPGSSLGALEFRGVGRHVDIPHTVFEILGQYPAKWTTYGTSLIKKNHDDADVFYTTTGAVNLVLEPTNVMTLPFFDIKKQEILKTVHAKDFSTKLVDKIAKKQKGRKLKKEIDEQFKVNKFKDVEKELKDYIYRLETNSLYKTINR